MSELYAIILTHTTDGHNKYYAMRVREEVGASGTIMYFLERRWGKIGTQGIKAEAEYSISYQAVESAETIRYNKEAKGYETKALWRAGEKII